MLEKCCRCKKTFNVPPERGLEELEFLERREYQVDIYPLYYKVYNNGGYLDYVFLSDEDFRKNFDLIL